jgi:tRNA(Arg) A34 adenosine deaminase TadA
MKRFFEMAKKISLKSPSRYKLGCVIVKRGRLQGVGWNNMGKTHPACKTAGNYFHAELHALIGLDKKETQGADLYVYRETRNGDLAQSRPCSVCYFALREAGIRNVCFTDYSGFKKEVVK